MGDMEITRKDIRAVKESTIVKIQYFDFSTASDINSMSALIKEISNLDISILINNVGVAAVWEYDTLPETNIRN